MPFVFFTRNSRNSAINFRNPMQTGFSLITNQNMNTNNKKTLHTTRDDVQCAKGKIVLPYHYVNGGFVTP